VPGAAQRPAARARLGQLAGQFLGQPQQRVRGTGHHVLRDLGDPPAARPRGAAQEVEGLPGAEPVPLGEHADGLLHPDTRGQGVL
jgi:hypothetical protein